MPGATRKSRLRCGCPYVGSPTIGNFAAAGAPQLTFVASNDVWIQADFTENNLGHVKRGDTVEVVFDLVSGGSTPGDLSDDIYTATVLGVADNYTILWTNDPADAWRIFNADSTDSDENDGFDIGGFNLLELQPTEDKVLDWTVRITDFDGDYDEATFSTGIDGTDDNDTVDFA